MLLIFLWMFLLYYYFYSIIIILPSPSRFLPYSFPLSFPLISSLLPSPHLSLPFSVKMQETEESLVTSGFQLDRLLRCYGEQLLQLKALELGHLNYMRERVGERHRSRVRVKVRVGVRVRG